MNRLSKAQKLNVTQLRSVTGCTDKVAIDCMQAGGWSVEAAVEIYYASGLQSAAPVRQQVNRGAVEKLFKAYADSSQGCIMAEGVGRFCEDLEVDPSDIVTLVISWHFNAATMCEFSKDEFVDGMLRLGCDSLEKLQQKLPALRAELRDEAKFRQVYDYAYMFSCEKGQKCVQLETAIGMWRLLFAEHSWVLLDDWCDFLQKNHKRPVSRDTWVQLLDFCKLKPDFRKWDPSGAWYDLESCHLAMNLIREHGNVPYLIDEFAELCAEKQGAKAA